MARSMVEDGVRVAAAQRRTCIRGTARRWRRWSGRSASCALRWRMPKLKAGRATGRRDRARRAGRAVCGRAPAVRAGRERFAVRSRFRCTGGRSAWRSTVSELGREGVRSVLAHPERNPEVEEDPGVRAAGGAGSGAAATAAAVDGRMGKRQAKCAFELLERGLAFLVASDAHAPGVREAGLSAARRAVGDEALGLWLTEDVPAELLRGSRYRSCAVPRRRRLFGHL